jgi:hypothetical protein
VGNFYLLGFQVVADLSGRDQASNVICQESCQPLQKGYVADVVTRDDILEQDRINDVFQIIEFVFVRVSGADHGNALWDAIQHGRQAAESERRRLELGDGAVGNRADLSEIRANAFAAVFLMPEKGLRRFVQGLGKGQARRSEARIFDETDVTRGQLRAKPYSQEIQIYDFALEAYRRELISQAKLRGLAAMVGMPVEVMLSLLQEDEDGKKLE